MMNPTKFVLHRGELWWVNLSISSTDIVGHEQSYTRPCLIIKDNKFTEMATIIPFTKNIKFLKFPYTYYVKKSEKNNLKFDSVALLFQIRSLSYIRYTSSIGTLEKKHLDKI